MKLRQIACLLLSIAMVSGMLSGCGNSQPEVTESAQNTPSSQAQEVIVPEQTERTAEEKIGELDIPDSWKQELLLAAYIGIPLDNLEKSPITGAEMMELLDSLVAHIKNFVFENNIVTHSGMGWVRDMIQKTDGVTSGFLSVFETIQSAVDNDGILYP